MAKYCLLPTGIRAKCMIKSNNDLATAERTENIQNLGGNANIRATTTLSTSLNASNCPSRRFAIQFAKYFDNKSYVAAPLDETCQCATRMYMLWLVAHRDCRQTKQKEDKAAIRVAALGLLLSLVMDRGLNHNCSESVTATMGSEWLGSHVLFFLG